MTDHLNQSIGQRLADLENDELFAKLGTASDQPLIAGHNVDDPKAFPQAFPYGVPPQAHDPVQHPAHYQLPGGAEAIDVCEWMSFNAGNAVKYLIRAGRKGDALEDLQKAAWYVVREIERIKRPP